MTRVVWFSGVTSAAVVCLLTIVSAADGNEGIRCLPPDVPPVMITWFWTEQPEFQPDGYRDFIDMMSKHSDANVLATSLRAPLKEVTDDHVHDLIKEAAVYARGRGFGIAMDLDVRLAREAFRSAHPNELQEMLRLREVTLDENGTARMRVVSTDLSDHYTGRTTHYIPLSGRLVRAYSYLRGDEGIDPSSVEDVTSSCCRVESASEKEVIVAIDCGQPSAGRRAVIAVCFKHLTPAVFSPHLVEFQRDIIRKYADVPLAGVCKDEWGFPPCFDGCPKKDDYWYSEFRAENYKRRTNGRDLVRDLLLMTFGEKGRLSERQAAINTFLEMSRLRNGAIEQEFYRHTKETFGPSAIVATHPTWYPYPGKREFKKNGLDWWIAPRDLAQTDEVTPYCVRTSLAKKWGSSVWYNMYYSSRVEDYRTELWCHALGGGRIDYHPVYPGQGHIHERYKCLFVDGIMRGDCRIRLLNFISCSPLDCPVAVIFGHACAMNWAGPAYDDVGVSVTDQLWAEGVPADLIPSSEVGSPALTISEDGFVQYGTQKYQAAILYHPEFEKPATAAFMRSAAAAGRTSLFQVGDWTRGFDGKEFDENEAMPGNIEVSDNVTSVVSGIVSQLRDRQYPLQSPARRAITGFNRRSNAPAAEGHCRLIDGTVIHVAGTTKPEGDPIRKSFRVNGHEVDADVIGLVAVRLSDDGQVEALAAGGLKRLAVGERVIELDQRTDIALWRDSEQRFHGVIQGWTGPIPKPLKAICSDWLRLDLPQSLQ